MPAGRRRLLERALVEQPERHGAEALARRLDRGLDLLRVGAAEQRRYACARAPHASRAARGTRA
jgi:hypothetical protein